MNFKAFSLAILTASVVLVQSCGTDTGSRDSELAAVLDAAGDREGVAHGECRDGCTAEGLAVFDECTAGGEHREACFGRAIHSFYECGEKCEPVTCEDECQARVEEEHEECIELTRNEGACGIESREFLNLCVDEFCDEPEPEPPTCEDGCAEHAEHVYDACMSKIDSEERCAAMAHAVLEHCIDRCEGHPCDCDRDCDCDDDDSDSDSDCDCDDGSDSDSDED
ncbi:MAG: hypothetical protein OEN21_16765 [Myxococcales bacterium]|nr:hypothetical protein [Myxococcales bacterium]